MPRKSSLPPPIASAAPNPSEPQWPLHAAKARLSEVFRLARSEGPQWITRQGKEAVVVIPAEQFERLRARTRQPKSLLQFFSESPLAGVNIDFERKPDYGRKVKL